MNETANDHDSEDNKSRPSREEIETLCILHAVGGVGCDAGDLSVRLGLSTTLASAVAESIQPLVAEGLLQNEDGWIERTDGGDRRLTARLAALGVG
jgi:hypothetical protein